MKYIKSHNDAVWVEPQVTKAIANKCNIFEADIVFVQGEVMCRHSWRPFKSCCKGSLQQYLDKVIEFVDYECVIQIEVKDADPGLIFKTVLLLQNYYPKFRHPVTFAIYGRNLFWRDTVAKAIVDKLKNIMPICLWEDWYPGKDLETLDLFENKKWWWY